MKNILKSLNSVDMIILVLIIYLFFITFKKKSRENFVEKENLIELVMTQTNVSREDAIKALNANDNNLLNAIQQITTQKELEHNNKKAIYELSEKFKNFSTKISNNEFVFNKLTINDSKSKDDFTNFIKNYSSKKFTEFDSEIRKRLTDKNIVKTSDLNKYKD